MQEKRKYDTTVINISNQTNMGIVNRLYTKLPICASMLQFLATE